MRSAKAIQKKQKLLVKASADTADIRKTAVGVKARKKTTATTGVVRSRRRAGASRKRHPPGAPVEKKQDGVGEEPGHGDSQGRGRVRHEAVCGCETHEDPLSGLESVAERAPDRGPIHPAFRVKRHTLAQAEGQVRQAVRKEVAAPSVAADWHEMAFRNLERAKKCSGSSAAWKGGVTTAKKDSEHPEKDERQPVPPRAAGPFRAITATGESRAPRPAPRAGSRGRPAGSPEGAARTPTRRSRSRLPASSPRVPGW